MRNQRGFTLIELLVVIAIIALLMGILMPALSVVREQGRRTACAHNEKNMGMGLFMYGHDYDGKLPMNTVVDRWLFDISYWTADYLMQSGGFDRHIFYCPSWSQRDRIIFWRYGENLPAGTPETYATPEPTDIAKRKDFHRIMGYYYFIDITTPTGGHWDHPPMSPDGQPKEWVRSLISTKQPPAMVELISDVTVSDGPNRDTADFSRAIGGCWTRWQIYDRSNHLKKGTKATGGNIFFVDGHGEWRRFEEMQHRWKWQIYQNPCFWW